MVFVDKLDKSNIKLNETSIQIMESILISHFLLHTALNDERGLLDLSEENLEKMHKIARRLREKKCRLTGPQANLTDLLNR